MINRMIKIFRMNRIFSMSRKNRRNMENFNQAGKKQVIK
jgi:hypothetical protein